jgi:tetratricopeptide (TPR) repeat protein
MHYEDARRLFVQVGDSHGENTARANHAWILFAEHRYTEFLRETEAVLDFYRHSGADRNRAITLRGIGLAEAELGRCAEAVAHLQEALAAFTRLGLQLDRAMALNGLGETYRRAGNRICAEEAHSQALAISERCGSVYERARAHHGLGHLKADGHELDLARSHWTKALADHRRLGTPKAPDTEALLAELGLVPRPASSEI